MNGLFVVVNGECTRPDSLGLIANLYYPTKQLTTFRIFKNRYKRLTIQRKHTEIVRHLIYVT
jgi:hypothetical protein